MESSKLDAAILRLKNKQIVESSYFKISKGWRDFFKSRSNLSASALLRFLAPDANIATGLAIQNNQYAAEEKSFRKLQKIILNSNRDIGDTSKLLSSEKLFGETTFDFEGRQLTRSNLVNMESLHQLRKALGVYKHEKLTVLEIGSGYGELARQVIKFSGLNISSWYLVDLPDNLLLAELYLGTVFGKNCIEKSNFFSKNSFETLHNHSVKIFFSVPSEIDDIKHSFDLIINTYSMQEMELDTVKAYMQFIKSHLNPDGKFFSINSPKKWEIRSYSDYKLDGLDNIYSSMHRQMPPSGPKATVPIVNLFSPSSHESSTHDIKIMDTIGELQVLGFSDFLDNLFCTNRLSITSPTDELKSFVVAVNEVREGTNLQHEVQIHTRVLGSILANRRIPQIAIEQFLKSPKVLDSLSHKSILSIHALTDNKIIHEKAAEICKVYKINLLKNKIGSIKRRIVSIIKSFFTK